MSSTAEKELIWVPKELAERHKAMESDKTKAEEQNKIVDEYISELSEQSRNDFKLNLEAMEEDAAIYAGLMLKVKQAFGKAKDEALSASYALWEKFDKERPDTSKKIASLVEMLQPLKNELNGINKTLSEIRTFDVDRFATSLRNLSGLYGESREMLEFVMRHFGEKDKARPAHKSAPENAEEARFTDSQQPQ